MITNRVSKRFGTVTTTKNRTAAIHLVQSSRLAQSLAKLILLGLVVAIAAMAFLPWQQTSRGTGEVTAFDPQQREQTIQSPVKGMVVEVAEGLVENARVEEGELLLKIQPYAANLDQLNAQLIALKNKEINAREEANANGRNVVGYTDARDSEVRAAQEMVESAKAKLQSTINKVAGLEAKELQTRLNYERHVRLLEKGLKSPKEVEILESKWGVAKADIEATGQEIAGLRNDVTAKKEQLEAKRSSAQTKIDYSIGLQQKALGNAETIRKNISELEMKLVEIPIYAPRTGQVFRLSINENGESVKEGDALLTIIPETEQNAVALVVNGNDMPFIEVGQEVRLQFEGWPAVQVAGWPSLAIGVFSGTVSTVDAKDNGKGEFRILVTPNKDDRAWPSQRFLRQGVRANGWVVLRKVTLGYEIWRQLNGFPVIISEEDMKKEKIAKPKIPK